MPDGGLGMDGRQWRRSRKRDKKRSRSLPEDRRLLVHRRESEPSSSEDGETPPDRERKTRSVRSAGRPASTSRDQRRHAQTPPREPPDPRKHYVGTADEREQSAGAST
eukprot:2015666-Karenia_brevis.AAC.1